jgi:YVTN family beta-propeller protein
MRIVSRAGLPALLFAPLLALLLWPTQAQTPHLLPQPPVGGTRGPSALLFRPDGSTLYVAEQDENDVAVLDPADGSARAHLRSGGQQPVALALSKEGRTLVVANRFSGTVGILNTATQQLQATVSLRGEPSGVAIAADGRAYVTLSQLDQVAVIDLTTVKVTARIPVGRRPHALALLPDGVTLLCANLIGGDLSVIDIQAGKERARIPLPGINLRGMALSADGTRVYVTAQQPHNDQPTERPEVMWSNLLCVVRLTPQGGSVARVFALDQPEYGAADPCGVALDAQERRAFVTLSGTHEVAVVPLTDVVPNTDTAQPQVRPAGLADAAPTGMARIPVGPNPRAIALRPNSSQLWVGNHLGNSLDVFSLRVPVAPVALPATRRVDLGTVTPSPNRRLHGRFLFASAHLTRGAHFTCETCHEDMASDGLSWKFAHVKNDGIDLRNTKDLRGEILLTAPYGWTGREEDFEVFVNDELAGLMRVHRLPHTEVHALWDLVNETPQLPNPYRNPDDTFTESARRGKALFEGKAGCTACHVGNMRGGTKKLEWIGTTPEGILLDVPHLAGVHESAPYLHDGRAATLEEIFTKYDQDRHHGKASRLTPPQFSDLIEYVREL